MIAFTFTHTFTLSASSDRVFAALTEPRELQQWFAEHVDVGSSAGEAYRFWGRHTLDTPGAEQATQRLTLFEAGQRLEFSWEIGTVPTMVSISLAAHTSGTQATVTHQVQGDLGRSRPRELIEDHWRLAFGNLMAHLGGGTGLLLPDYDDPRPEVHQVLTIAAPPHVVFQCLVEPTLVNQWFGTKAAEVEPREGGRYSLNWRYEVEGRTVEGGPTRILGFEQDRLLVLDWPDWRGEASVADQWISFSLQPVGDGTRLTFVHGGFHRTADLSDFPFGWSYFLGLLSEVARRAPNTAA